MTQEGQSRYTTVRVGSVAGGEMKLKKRSKASSVSGSRYVSASRNAHDSHDYAGKQHLSASTPRSRGMGGAVPYAHRPN